MFNVETQFTQDSQACPGARFTLRVLNQYQRSLRDCKIVEARARISEQAAQFAAVPDPDAEGASPGPEAAAERVQRATIDHRAGLIINTEIKPAYIRASLLSIEGLLLGGKPPEAPWDDLIQLAPDGLIDEIYAAAVQNSGLTEEQEKN